ncbi:MAG: xanthine dehydrogenase family protein molybdopterin-binding subunit [Candidatus Zhuqueibacterota bacterium]
MNTNFEKIGKEIHRIDGLEKVTGQALFADDYTIPGQLRAVMVRLSVSHALIRTIDATALANHQDVIAVCTASDIPGTKKIGLLKKDQPIFSHEKIVTPGDVVAMLVGPDEEKLIRLREYVRVDYQTLPPLTDPKLSLGSDAPLIHPELGSNLIIHYPLRKGDVEKGMAASDFVLEQTYTTQLIEHAYIEPEAVIAIPREGNKGIKIIGSIQNPFSARSAVASVLGWPLARVRVEQAELGGSFGGKDDTMNILAARAAIAALKTGRPVKIRYSREESVLESYKRHPYILCYKVGFNRDGKILAMKIDVLADGGAYASMSPFVTWRTVVQATGPYAIENVWTDVRAVYTNNPYTGAMRGFGSPQPIFAEESIMDEIAIRLGKTPVDIRRINGLRQGSYTASGQQLRHHDVNLLTVMDTAVRLSNFTQNWLDNHHQPPAFSAQDANDTGANGVLAPGDFPAAENRVRKGIGLALSYRGCSLGAEGIDAAAAYMAVQPDGSAHLSAGLAENGQGMRTTFAMIAAEVLGISETQIFYLELDTGLIPDSGPTVASRATLMGGGAVKLAAEHIRDRLSDFLRREWNLSEKDDLIFRGGIVRANGAREKQIAFSDLCRKAYHQGVNLSAIGWYPGPKVDWREDTGQGAAYFTYVYGCQVAEVSVNMVTGEVLVDRILAVHDPGKVINLLGARGQVFGGVTQGAGYGLWEEITASDGFIRELNFDQILIPTSKDIGEIVPVFIEGNDTYGPWGAKSLGEPTLELTAAAIANAVRNATGRRFFNLPLNLEEIILNHKLRPPDAKRGSSR